MEKIRVLVAKPGLDGHDRGALVIAQALRDQGMEVIYTGLRQSPEQIVASAIQEDVDCIGLSCLSGAHNELFPEVVRLLKEQEAGDILVIGGGVIPQEDIPFLVESGVDQIFTPGTPTSDIGTYIKMRLGKAEQTAQIKVKAPKKVAHIGIAVKSIDEVLPLYEQVLGLELLKVEVVESEQVKVAFLKIGETKIELLESLSPAGPIAQHIEKRGAGLHHIALEVDDLEARVEAIKAAGFKLIPEQPKQGAEEALITFLHPKEMGGALIELCQYPKK